MSGAGRVCYAVTTMEQVIILLALILSIILHEVAHGFAANALGDPTARLQGRLSLNPLVHIDPLGSVIVPALMYLSGTNFLFGWAKPVPYNPYNLKNQRYGDALVAAAGPGTNLLLAVIFAVIIRFAAVLALSPTFVSLAAMIVYINILLAFFNLIPLPPLDGSKILMAVLPLRAQMNYRNFLAQVERYGIVVTFLFIFIFIQLLWVPFAQFVGLVFSLLTGLHGF